MLHDRDDAERLTTRSDRDTPAGLGSHDTPATRGEPGNLCNGHTAKRVKILVGRRKMSAVMDRPDGDTHEQQTPTPQDEAQRIAKRSTELATKWSLFRECWPDAHDQELQLKRFAFYQALVTTGVLNEDG